MKGITVLLALLLVSCADVQEKEKTNAVTLPTFRAVAKEKTLQNAEDLSGLHFLLGAGMDDTSCLITEACDCCNADLIFLSGKQFILDDLCEGHFVKKGTYRFNGKELILNFEPLLVSFFHNEASETDPSLPETILQSEYRETSVKVYSLGECKGNVVLTNQDTLEEATFAAGTLTKKATTSRKLEVLKQIGAWELLAIH